MSVPLEPMTQSRIVARACACLLSLMAWQISAQADESNAESYWLEFRDGYGGWLEIDKSLKHGRLLWRVGSPRKVRVEQSSDGSFELIDQRRKAPSNYVAIIKGTAITVTKQLASDADAIQDEHQATGERCPGLPPKPDLRRIRFGDAIDLLGTDDLSAWRLHPPDAKNGWRIQNGELINTTPKTDFGAYGDHANLATVGLYDDFQLHIEFNVESNRNSGIYLRGLYEVQVVDRDSPMQGINGPGAVFGRLEPSKNAGLPGGQWQSYDLTLVDRHITVVLNGEKVIDNQPVPGCTGGALLGNVSRPGPIYLQGDHTSVRYRN
ncbi:MAG: DUF1080 domain-containing protein, partial [Planctomycetota bacterium]